MPGHKCVSARQNVRAQMKTCVPNRTGLEVFFKVDRTANALLADEN